MELSAKNFLWMLIFQWNLWFLIFQKYVKMRGSKNGTLIWWVNAISILLPASYDVIFSYTFPLWIMWFFEAVLWLWSCKIFKQKVMVKTPPFFRRIFREVVKMEFFPESREIFPMSEWKKSEKWVHSIFSFEK